MISHARTVTKVRRNKVADDHAHRVVEDVEDVHLARSRVRGHDRGGAEGRPRRPRVQVSSLARDARERRVRRVGLHRQVQPLGGPRDRELLRMRMRRRGDDREKSNHTDRHHRTLHLRLLGWPPSEQRPRLARSRARRQLPRRRARSRTGPRARMHCDRRSMRYAPFRDRQRRWRAWRWSRDRQAPSRRASGRARAERARSASCVIRRGSVVSVNLVGRLSPSGHSMTSARRSRRARRYRSMQRLRWRAALRSIPARPRTRLDAGPRGFGVHLVCLLGRRDARE